MQFSIALISKLGKQILQTKNLSPISPVPRFLFPFPGFPTPTFSKLVHGILLLLPSPQLPALYLVPITSRAPNLHTSCHLQTWQRALWLCRFTETRISSQIYNISVYLKYNGRMDLLVIVLFQKCIYLFMIRSTVQNQVSVTAFRRFRECPGLMN